jgi:hypothetical protein
MVSTQDFLTIAAFYKGTCLSLLHSQRLLWMHIFNEAIHVSLVTCTREASRHLLHKQSHTQPLFCHNVQGLCELFQGAQCCWRAFKSPRPGSHWQKDPGAPWFGWHLTASDFPADEMSESVDTQREEQVLTSDPQPSGTFPVFLNWKIIYSKLLTFSSFHPVPKCHLPLAKASHGATDSSLLREKQKCYLWSLPYFSSLCLRLEHENLQAHY